MIKCIPMCILASAVSKKSLSDVCFAVCESALAGRKANLKT